MPQLRDGHAMTRTSWPRNTYSSSDVCRLAGITTRQLDYWCRNHLVWPSIQDANGSGNRRRFSPDDVLLFRLLALCRVILHTLNDLRPVADGWRHGAFAGKEFLVIAGGYPSGLTAYDWSGSTVS